MISFSLISLTAGHCISVNGTEYLTGISTQAATVDYNVPGITLYGINYWYIHSNIDDIGLIETRTHITPGFLVNIVRIPSSSQANEAFTFQTSVS